MQPQQEEQPSPPPPPKKPNEIVVEAGGAMWLEHFKQQTDTEPSEEEEGLVCRCFNGLSVVCTSQYDGYISSVSAEIRSTQPPACLFSSTSPLAMLAAMAQEEHDEQQIQLQEDEEEEEDEEEKQQQEEESNEETEEKEEVKEKDKKTQKIKTCAPLATLFVACGSVVGCTRPFTYVELGKAGALCVENEVNTEKKKNPKSTSSDNPDEIPNTSKKAKPKEIVDKENGGGGSVFDYRPLGALLRSPLCYPCCETKAAAAVGVCADRSSLMSKILAFLAPRIGPVPEIALLQHDKKLIIHFVERIVVPEIVRESTTLSAFLAQPANPDFLFHRMKARSASTSVVALLCAQHNYRRSEEKRKAAKATKERTRKIRHEMFLKLKAERVALEQLEHEEQEKKKKMMCVSHRDMLPAELLRKPAISDRDRFHKLWNAPSAFPLPPSRRANAALLGTKAKHHVSDVDSKGEKKRVAPGDLVEDNTALSLNDLLHTFVRRQGLGGKRISSNRAPKCRVGFLKPEVFNNDIGLSDDDVDEAQHKESIMEILQPLRTEHHGRPAQPASAPPTTTLPPINSHSPAPSPALRYGPVPSSSKPSKSKKPHQLPPISSAEKKKNQTLSTPPAKMEEQLEAFHKRQAERTEGIRKAALQRRAVRDKELDEFVAVQAALVQRKSGPN